MKLYMKQRFFSWRDKFSVYNEAGEEIYYVEGEVFTLGKRLHLYDRGGRELAFISQRLLTFLPKFEIDRTGKGTVEMVKHFTLFRHEYSIEALGWSVSGDFFEHEYEICTPNQLVARVFREWFTLGDAYAIEVAQDEDEVMALAVALVVDAVLESHSRE